MRQFHIPRVALCNLGMWKKQLFINVCKKRIVVFENRYKTKGGNCVE
jgi:hypothetical protein